MRLLAVFRWIFLIALIAVAAMGAAGVWLWANSDSLIRKQLLQTFDKRAPDLQLQLDSIQLLSTSSVRIKRLEIRDRKTNKPLARIEELTAEIDEAVLAEKQQILLRELHVKGFDILLERSADGRWNWQEYEFVKDETIPFIPPTVTIENLRAQIQMDHGDGIPPASLMLTSSQFQAVPSSGDGYDFLGALVLPGAGSLQLKGGCDLAEKTWNLSGSVNGLTANQSLVEIAKSTAPQLAARLEQLDSTMQRVLPMTADAASATDTSSTALMIGNSSTSPRFTGTVDVDFSVEKKSGQKVPDLRLKVDIHDGQLSSPVLPFHLTDVQARFFWQNSDVSFQLMNARDGDALATGDFQMSFGENAPAPTATLHLEKFPVTMQLKPLLPPKSQKFFDHFQPGGTISGDARVQRFPNGKWLPVSVEGHSDDGTMVFHKFRSPATGIKASLKQRPLPENPESMLDVIFDVEANGTVNGRPVNAIGWLKNVGPEMELRFDVHVDDFPIDSRFRDALDEQGRKVIETINITGMGSAEIACYRPPGLDKPTDIILVADVKDSRIRFRGFPYDIDRLTGHVEFRSAEKTWTFSGLRGYHGPAELTGQGRFRGLPAPGVLDLTIGTVGANLDADLFNALNESSRSVWSIINPESGKVSLTTQVSWTAVPGQKPIVRLEDVSVYDAVITPRPFPYRMKILSSKFSYDPNDPRAAGRQHCEIKQLKAEHDGALITGGGWAEVGTAGDWQVHLNDLNAVDLKPDDDLRAALPESWRGTLSRLGQAGRVSIEGSEIDFRGMTRDPSPPTAAWRMNVRLKSCEVAAGLDLRNVSGLVRAAGQWDGVSLKNQGEIRLDRVDVLDMTIAGINGPYSMSDDELVLGSREVILGNVRPDSVLAEERIRAQAYGGTLEMDGMIDLRAGQGYRFFAELKNALLADYARKHMPEQRGLEGVVNSWIFVFGDGDSPKNLQGKGQLQINPAALYEVPVVLELISAMSRLNFTVSNRTAFNYALMTFTIQDEAFWFDPIDLVGDALSLRGRGHIGFGGDILMDFFSRPPRPTGPRVPFSNLLMSGATQWVTVQVRGTIDRPQTEVSNRPKIDENIRQLLSNFEPRPGGPTPGLVLPNLLGLPMIPAQPPMQQPAPRN